MCSVHCKIARWEYLKGILYLVLINYVKNLFGVTDCGRGKSMLHNIFFTNFHKNINKNIWLGA